MSNPPPFLDITLGEMLTQLSGLYPQQEALVCPNLGLRWSFAELEREAIRMARGLLSIGIGKGDRVAVWAPNVPEWIVLQFALAKVGAVLVTVNTALVQGEVEYLLRQSETSVLIAAPGFRGIDYLAAIRAIVPEIVGAAPGQLRSERLPYLRWVVTIGNSGAKEVLTCSDVADLGCKIPLEALRDRESELKVDDVINMQFTSGTTGFPKGVMLSHRNILNNGSSLGDAVRFTPSDRLCLTVPLFHCFGCVIGVLGAYTHGATLVPLEYFDAGTALRTIQDERCTAVYGVPTMFIAMLEHPEFASFDLTTLRAGVMAGALCPMDLMRRSIERMHLRDLIIAYGLTEASPGVTCTSPEDSMERRTQTVGRALPRVEVRIAGPVDDQALPPGQQGELQTRGYHVMKGYYKNADATRDALARDGWLRTGDLAVMDEEGYVTITGRIKEMIIRGGENIYPKEIEEVVRRIPAVSDVAVYGVPSSRYGEEVAAAVKIRSGCNLSEGEVRRFCEANLARFKVPRYLKFVDQFPQTASGKIQKFLLRKRAAEDFGLEE